jgi:hypothetical protein
MEPITKEEILKNFNPQAEVTITEVLAELDKLKKEGWSFGINFLSSEKAEVVFQKKHIEYGLFQFSPVVLVSKLNANFYGMIYLMSRLAQIKFDQEIEKQKEQDRVNGIERPRNYLISGIQDFSF